VAKATDSEGGKIGGFFSSIPEFVQQVGAERRKISWPTRRETLMTAMMVVIMTTLLGLFFLAVDSTFNAITQALLKLIA
jgi:preprotein translocase subunit SecE